MLKSVFGNECLDHFRVGIDFDAAFLFFFNTLQTDRSFRVFADGEIDGLTELGRVGGGQTDERDIFWDAVPACFNPNSGVWVKDVSGLLEKVVNGGQGFGLIDGNGSEILADFFDFRR